MAPSVSATPVFRKQPLLRMASGGQPAAPRIVSCVFVMNASLFLFVVSQERSRSHAVTISPVHSCRTVHNVAEKVGTRRKERTGMKELKE